MKRLSVAISDAAMDRLREVALTERRDVREQAAYLLERVLDHLGSPAADPIVVKTKHGVPYVRETEAVSWGDPPIIAGSAQRWPSVHTAWLED